MNLEESVYRYTTRVDNSSLTLDSTSAKNVYSLMEGCISRQACIVIFAILTFSVIVVILIRSAMLVSVCLKASLILHNAMFNSITRATMYFFNTNSSGKNYEQVI